MRERPRGGRRQRKRRHAPRRGGRYFVYVVRCSDGTYYTGSTRDIGNRIQQHNAGDGAKYLRGKRPVKLVYAREYRQRTDALRGERNLKKLSRKQKEALVRAQPRPAGRGGTPKRWRA